ncbi:GDP-mannose 4,6-dehydratase [Rhizobium ruizarguesonis]
MTSKKALICGISGQDGTFLADLLLREGYEVIGTSRDAATASFRNLERLELRDRVQLVSMAPTDFRSVLQTLSRFQPHEIYNLAGQSSVGLSFEQPVETMESIAFGTLHILEAIRFLGLDMRFYNAGSSECFGNTGGHPADENTPFRHRSPYAVAKAAAQWEVANYRDAYGQFACTGILFNHESPLRPERFVTKKIVSTACKIAQGSKQKLKLGNIEITRDWGWAPEYVQAMWLMLQQEIPDDYVIATGRSHSLEEFLDKTFRRLGLEWQEHVETSAEFRRPSDIAEGHANPAKARAQLGWTSTLSLDDIIDRLVSHELSSASP